MTGCGCNRPEAFGAASREARVFRLVDQSPAAADQPVAAADGPWPALLPATSAALGFLWPWVELGPASLAPWLPARPLPARPGPHPPRTRVRGGGCPELALVDTDLKGRTLFGLRCLTGSRAAAYTTLPADHQLNRRPLDVQPPGCALALGPRWVCAVPWESRPE